MDSVGSRAVRYTYAPDGIQIAFRVLGDGPPIIRMPGIVSNLPFEHRLVPEQPISQLDERLAKRYQVIRYDSRGQGLSDRAPEDLSASSLEADLEAVIAALDLSKVALFATVQSGPLAISFAASHPDRVSHLILYNTFASAEHYFESPLVRALEPLIGENWELFSNVLMQARYRWLRGPHAIRKARLFSESMSSGVFAKLHHDQRDFDVVDKLELIEVPTLVIHRPLTSILDVSVSKFMASRIRGAQFVLLQLDKPSPPHEINALHKTVTAFLSKPEGRLNSSSAVVTSSRQDINGDGLTQRELQILSLLARGLRNKQIADELGIGVQTVERHVANIFLKLDFHTRVEAAIYAIHSGLTSLANSESLGDKTQ